MKEHRNQILAVLALALVLGTAMPAGAVFAEDREAAGAAETTETKEAEKEATDAVEEEALGLAESVAELYKRIQDRDSFKDFRQMAEVVANTQTINGSDLMEDAQTWAESFTPYNYMGTAWFRMSGATKEAIQGKKVYQVLDVLKSDALYSATYAGTYPAKVDNLIKLDTDLKAEQVALLKVAMPDLKDVDTMTLQMLVGAVEQSNGYAKNAALVSAMMFASEAITDGDLSMSKLQAMYGNDVLAAKYIDMANAAVAIDDTVLNGLDASWNVKEEKEEETGVKTPDTGILDVVEAGALDLATLTLIAAVAVAMLSGSAVIAKLYLRHKF